MGKKKTNNKKRSLAEAQLSSERTAKKRATEEEDETEEVEETAEKERVEEEEAADSKVVDGEEKASERLVSSETVLGAPCAKQGKVRKVIIFLDEATLEPVKTSKGGFEILNCDDHLGLHKKLNKDPARSRPDIAHQMLLTVLDSPLNKAGHVEVYIRTNKNVLIKVSEHLRIPRTFKRFSGLMVQLLHKMKIRAKDGNKTLMKVVKNPITNHLPPNARVFLASVTGTLVDVHEFVPALPDTDPYVFIFGAFAHGHVQADFAEAALAFSEYSLSGACALGRLLGAFERKWNII